MILAICQSIGETLSLDHVDDLPMIRQSLNDAVDMAVRDGEMTEAQANDWDQDWAVEEVQRIARRERL